MRMRPNIADMSGSEWKLPVPRILINTACAVLFFSVPFAAPIRAPPATYLFNSEVSTAHSFPSSRQATMPASRHAIGSRRELAALGGRTAAFLGADLNYFCLLCMPPLSSVAITCEKLCEFGAEAHRTRAHSPARCNRDHEQECTAAHHLSHFLFFSSPVPIAFPTRSSVDPA